MGTTGPTWPARCSWPAAPSSRSSRRRSERSPVSPNATPESPRGCSTPPSRSAGRSGSRLPPPWQRATPAPCWARATPWPPRSPAGSSGRSGSPGSPPWPPSRSPSCSSGTPNSPAPSRPPCNARPRYPPPPTDPPQPTRPATGRAGADRAPAAHRGLRRGPSRPGRATPACPFCITSPEVPAPRHEEKEIVIMVTIAGKTVLVTGANRGIGQALVAEALARGAARVYAGTRQPFSHPDERVTPVTLDVTDAAQIQAAAGQVESLDVLINNAGIWLSDDLSDRAALERHLAVNLFGMYGMTQAFLPLLARSRGAIVNNLSLNALAPLPLTPAYAVSKAAAFSLTQSLRALWAGRGVRVHAVLTGPVDTEMTRGFDIPKSSAESVAAGIFDGVENGEEDIFPDPYSQAMADRWRDGAAKALERELAAFVDAEPVR